MTSKTLDDMWYEYADFLLDIINFHDKRWMNVIYSLHNIKFISQVEMDENREMDGRMNRVNFLKGKVRENQDIFEFYPTSVLEVLVAFVDRVSDEYIWTIGDDGESKKGIIFEVFLLNLGLNPRISHEKLRENVSFWLNREYGDDGKGSIMPLNYPKRGYKMMEMWSQINIFLSEFDLKIWSDFEIFL